MSEPVYTVLVEDRHVDIEVKVFGNYKKARAWVAELVEMYCGHGYKPEDFAHRGSKDKGWERWGFGESNAITLQRQDLL